MALRPPLPPLDEHYAAAACFHGLLGVLQRPLAHFLYARCAEVAARGPTRRKPDPKAAQAAWNVVHAALRKQLEFLRVHERPGVVEDVAAILTVQSACFFSPNVSLATHLKGIAAAARLVRAIGADAYALEQVEVFERMLCVPVQDRKEAGRGDQAVIEEEDKPVVSVPVEESKDGNDSKDGDDDHAIQSRETEAGDKQDSPNIDLRSGNGPSAGDDETAGRPTSLTGETIDGNAERPTSVRKVRQVQLNGAKMRKWLVGQAFRIIDALPYREGQEAEVGMQEVVRLLAEALKYSKNQRQRGDIFIMRSEFHLSVGQLELASEDAHAALMPMNIRSINHVKRIAMVFLNLGRFEDAALAYDTGLKQYPGNRQLLECKKYLQAYEDQYLQRCDEASDVSALTDGRASFGLYQNTLWAHADPATQVEDGVSSDRSSWTFAQSELQLDTQEQINLFNTVNGTEEGIPDEEISDQEEIEDDSWLEPTNSAFLVVEFALNTESRFTHSLPIEYEPAVEKSLEVLESPCNQTCPESNTAPANEPTEEHFSTQTRSEESLERVKETEAAAASGATESRTSPIGHFQIFEDDQLKRRHAMQKSFRIGCFHALLSTLRSPLVEYIVERQAEGPPLNPDDQKLYKNVRKAGFKTLLQFVKTYWRTHFKASTPSSLLKNLKMVDQVQSQIVYTATARSSVIDDGIKALERVFVTLAADAETVRLVRMIKESIGCAIEECSRIREMDGDFSGACSAAKGADTPTKIQENNVSMSGVSSLEEAAALFSTARSSEFSKVSDDDSLHQPDFEPSGREEQDLAIKERMSSQTTSMERAEKPTHDTAERSERSVSPHVNEPALEERLSVVTDNEATTTGFLRDIANVSGSTEGEELSDPDDSSGNFTPKPS